MVRTIIAPSLSVHAFPPGHAEHISRYDHFFRLLAAPPSSIHITAFDQRGFGRTAGDTLSPDSADVKRWKAEGKAVRIDKNGKRKTGGWVKVMPDIEWFVKREKERAGSKKLFLHGFSMVCPRSALAVDTSGTEATSGGRPGSRFCHQTCCTAVAGDDRPFGRGHCRWTHDTVDRGTTVA